MSSFVLQLCHVHRLNNIDLIIIKSMVMSLRVKFMYWHHKCLLNYTQSLGSCKKKHSPSSSIKLDKNWVKSRLYLCWPKANMSQYVWMPFVSWCYTCNNLKKNSLGLCHFLGIQKGSIAHSFWQYGAVCKHCVKQSWTDPNSKIMVLLDLQSDRLWDQCYQLPLITRWHNSDESVYLDT